MADHDGIDLEQLHAFSAHLEVTPAAAQDVQACSQPSEIINIAEKLGYTLTVSTLRAHSKNLAAPHWPWAGKGTPWRRQFFATNSDG